MQAASLLLILEKKSPAASKLSKLLCFTMPGVMASKVSKLLCFTMPGVMGADVHGVGVVGGGGKGNTAVLDPGAVYVL